MATETETKPELNWADLDEWVKGAPEETVLVTRHILHCVLKSIRDLQTFSSQMNAKNIERNGRIAELEKKIGDLEYRALQLDSEHSSRLRELEARPTMRHLGTYQAGATYVRGDCVTDRGSCWHCKAESTTIRPDYTPFAAQSWSLITKAGRDGKDAMR